MEYPMNHDVVIIDHKEESKQGLWYLFSTVVCAVVFFFMRDQFVDWAVRWFLPLLVLTMLLCSAYFIINSRRRDIVDAEGIRVESPFGSKTYSWSDACKFEIKWTWGRKNRFAIKNEKLPYIRLVYSNPRRELRFAYREDLERCVCRFYGEPDCDTWSVQAKKQKKAQS